MDLVTGFDAGFDMDLLTAHPSDLVARSADMGFERRPTYRLCYEPRAPGGWPRSLGLCRRTRA
jgi:hypothetical protein